MVHTSLSQQTSTRERPKSLLMPEFPIASERDADRTAQKQLLSCGPAAAAHCQLQGSQLDHTDTQRTFVLSTTEDTLVSRLHSWTQASPHTLEKPYFITMAPTNPHEQQRMAASGWVTGLGGCVLKLTCLSSFQLGKVERRATCPQPLLLVALTHHADRLRQ